MSLTFDQPGICETTPGVKSCSGYVRLPPGLLRNITGEEQDYPINTYETARKYDIYSTDLRIASFGSVKHIKTPSMLLYPYG
jgi:hypothetical protein